MRFDLAATLESKRRMRVQLARLPIAQKLAILDLLRDRTLALRKATPLPKPKDSAPGSE